MQLQKHTAQPTQHLKEVLAEIAVKNLRGPYKDLWELKKGGCCLDRLGVPQQHGPLQALGEHAVPGDMCEGGAAWPPAVQSTRRAERKMRQRRSSSSSRRRQHSLPFLPAFLSNCLPFQHCVMHFIEVAPAR